jgi:hypothetical protein
LAEPAVFGQIEFTHPTRFVAVHVLSPLETDFSELASATGVAIHVPIGFGLQKADVAARALLVGAASTVFTTPSRETFEKPFGPGLGVSAQAYALGKRILCVTALARSDPGSARFIQKSHLGGRRFCGGSLARG